MGLVEGLGDEVILFGGITIICSILLLKCLQMFYSNTDSGSNQSSGGYSVEGGRTRTTEIDCCICLGDTRYGVETNCGHIYCGDCILEVYRRSSSLQAMSCPYCRQRITLMLPYLSEDERLDSADPRDNETRNRIFSEITQYNRRFSGESRSLMEHLRDLPVLLRHLWNFLWSGEGFHFAFQIRVFILFIIWIAYFLSPLDLLPEAFFGIIGLLDDLIIFIMISMHLTYFFRQIIINVMNNRLNDTPGINQ